MNHLLDLQLMTVDSQNPMMEASCCSCCSTPSFIWCQVSSSVSIILCK